MWSNILSTYPRTIKKKMDWYEKQKAQTSLEDFVEDKEENDGERTQG